ncbi:MAG: 5-oxoprolinase subunit C family protein [bacterium]
MIKVLSAGVLSTIQDLGRFEWRHLGVPISGVMDSYAAKLGNQCLDNDLNDAVLEFTLLGPKLQFEISTQICITGADFKAKLNQQVVTRNKPIVITKGDVLSFGSAEKGARGYLAVAKGFKTEFVLNSRSMYDNITQNTKLNKDDMLLAEQYTEPFTAINAQVKPMHYESNVLTVFKGPEFEFLNQEQQQLLLNKSFSVSNTNNRMAYQLNEPILNELPSIITSPVLPGTVQLTPSGTLIILMRDCQTTGGYPRVLQLSEQAINLLAQKKSGDMITFEYLVKN